MTSVILRIPPITGNILKFPQHPTNKHQFLNWRYRKQRFLEYIIQRDQPFSWAVCFCSESLYR